MIHWLGEDNDTKQMVALNTFELNIEWRFILVLTVACFIILNSIDNRPTMVEHIRGMHTVHIGCNSRACVSYGAHRWAPNIRITL